jgi:hypothetical protein
VEPAARHDEFSAGFYQIADDFARLIIERG